MASEKQPFGRSFRLMRQKNPKLDKQFYDLTIASADLGTPCQSSPDLWWEDDKRLQDRAIEGCAACPIRQQCLEWALAANESSGVWGGTTPSERQYISKRLYMDDRNYRRRVISAQERNVEPPEAPIDPLGDLRRQILKEREQSA